MMVKIYSRKKPAWALINQLNWDKSKQEGDDSIITPLINALADESLAHIYQFADWLAKKIWQLDTPVHANNIIEQDGFFILR